MFTGNSESTQSFYSLMRQMGAAARELLTQVAASRWGVAPASCRAEKSFIIHGPTGRRLSCGELATEAALLPVPAKPSLRRSGELALVGKRIARVDVPEQVDGSGVFGIDFRVPGMPLAAVRTAPTLAGRLRGVDQTPVAGLPGVRAVVPLDNGGGGVAHPDWEAREAVGRLPPDFEPGPNLDISSDSLRAEYLRILDAGPWVAPVNEGAVDAALKTARRTMTADYASPFLAHATMEPMNCTASVTPDGCDIWAPTQGQELAFFALKAVLGLRDDQIRVNRSNYAGGGFGRRLLPDFVVQAALVSKAVGRPVKVIWDREEDVRRDYFRPASMVRMTAGLDASGRPTAVAARVVSPTILLPVFPAIEPVLREKGIDPSPLQGMLETIYDLPNRRVAFHLFKTTIPPSRLRTTPVMGTPGFGPNIFAIESFVDELAGAAAMDPLEYRRRLLGGSPRALRVLERAAVLGGWGRPLPKGQGRGLAVTRAFGTFLAQVVEVAVEAVEVRVKRVVSVVDCGQVLDPGIATSNIQGGGVFGL